MFGFDSIFFQIYVPSSEYSTDSGSGSFRFGSDLNIRGFKHFLTFPLFLLTSVKT